MISVHEVNNKILSCDSNYIVNMVMWPKFGNPGIARLQLLKNLTRKTSQ